MALYTRCTLMVLVARRMGRRISARMTSTTASCSGNGTSPTPQTPRERWAIWAREPASQRGWRWSCQLGRSLGHMHSPMLLSLILASQLSMPRPVRRSGNGRPLNSLVRSHKAMNSEVIMATSAFPTPMPAPPSTRGVLFTLAISTALFMPSGMTMATTSFRTRKCPSSILVLRSVMGELLSHPECLQFRHATPCTSLRPRCERWQSMVAQIGKNE
mmetsp:Transcript_135907/g.290466  ORF Transcript_135907/g.290466 Transcript_135907/m.290466 type:complete len:216 (-) Transcript_135907:43-690(-)